MWRIAVWPSRVLKKIRLKGVAPAWPWYRWGVGRWAATWSRAPHARRGVREVEGGCEAPILLAAARVLPLFLLRSGGSHARTGRDAVQKKSA